LSGANMNLSSCRNRDNLIKITLVQKAENRNKKRDHLDQNRSSPHLSPSFVSSVS
jgi:hypothetical protein